MDLSWTTRVVAEHAVLQMVGDIDVHTSPRLRQKLVALTESGQNNLVLDLSAVGFLDSSGIGVLVGGLKRTRAHDGEFHLAGPRDAVRKVFQLSGLTRVFSTHDSVADALATRAD